jgi:hypothetical protein
MGTPGSDERPRKEAVFTWSHEVFAKADLAPTPAQFDDIASTMAGSIVVQILVPLAEERGASGFLNYLDIYKISEENVLEHFNGACSILAIMIVKAGGQEPQGRYDPLLIKVENEIDARMKNLLDLALPEWADGVRQEYGP